MMDPKPKSEDLWDGIAVFIIWSMITIHNQSLSLSSIILWKQGFRAIGPHFLASGPSERSIDLSEGPEAKKRRPIARNPCFRNMIDDNDHDWLCIVIIKSEHSVREVLTLYIFDVQKPLGFRTFDFSNVQKHIGFWTSERYDVKNPTGIWTSKGEKSRTSRTELGGELARWVRVQWDKGAGVP